MENLTLSPQQASAINAIRCWYKKPITESQVFILNGYAGVGKTSLAKCFPEMITEQDKESVIYAAFTGKAALQLRKKGCDTAITLHKLLYEPLEKNRKRLLGLIDSLKQELLVSPLADSVRAQQLKKELVHERRRVSTPSWQMKVQPLDPEIQLLVVDEHSMVDEKIYDDLLTLKKKIVFLGDPFQLPPVRGSSPLSQQDADFTLTEVHRQALDNPILKAATELRNGTYPSPAHGQDKFSIIKIKEATYEDYANADQVLCGRNATRRELNKRLRSRLVQNRQIDSSSLPAAKGDKVVFLRNDHEEGIFNGTTATLSAVFRNEDSPDGTLAVDLSGDEEILGYEVWPGVIDGQDISEAPRRTQVIDHAYALTVHKAQGSEWRNVCIHQEPVGHGQDAMRWLYTAITRAQEKCTIVCKD